MSQKERSISSETSAAWLFLLFNLPAKHASERVKVWRRLKKFGAVQLKTSTYVLPDEPAHYERFQWLAKEIDDSGGEATLVRVKDIEGMPYAAVVALFNEARARDYDEIIQPLTQLIKQRKARKMLAEAFEGQLEKVRRSFQEIQEIDYFQSTRGEDIRALFQKAELLGAHQKKTETKSSASSRGFSRKNLGHAASTRNRSGGLGLANY